MRALRGRGLERIAVEEPGWAQHRLVAEHAGLEPVGVPVDEQGIDVAALSESGCEAVVVTPAHQFPTGVVLTPARRAALLEWAEDEDALIVEDDYDSELRYDRGPVGALQGLAPERVCQIGSASNRLVPALRLGWILSPSWLTGELTYEQGAGASAPPVPEQRALADFIARGELDRHLRRMRLRYRSRRGALVDALARELPEAEVVGIAAGLFTLVLLPAEVDESALVSAAASRGVGVEGLSWHCAGAPTRPGLVLGYANLSDPAIGRGCAGWRRRCGRLASRRQHRVHEREGRDATGLLGPAISNPAPSRRDAQAAARRPADRSNGGIRLRDLGPLASRRQGG